MFRQKTEGHSEGEVICNNVSFHYYYWSDFSICSMLILKQSIFLLKLIKKHILGSTDSFTYSLFNVTITLIE